MFPTTAGASAAVGAVGSFSFLGWSYDVRIEQCSAGCQMQNCQPMRSQTIQASDMSMI